MKLVSKIVCSVVAVVSLASCGGPRYVQQSNIAVTSPNYRVVYFRESEVGNLIYTTWLTGAYGDTTEVRLLPEEEFNRYFRKSKRN